MNCRLFENRILFAQPSYDVQSRVSVDSFRTFVDAIGGTEPDITDDNVTDLEVLSGEFKFATLSAAVADWRAAHPSPESATTLTTASLDERLQSQDRAICLLDRKVDRLSQAPIGARQVKIAEAVESIQRKNAAFPRLPSSRGPSASVSRFSRRSAALDIVLTRAIFSERRLTARNTTKSMPLPVPGGICRSAHIAAIWHLKEGSEHFTRKPFRVLSLSSRERS
jgi:hypothetical protein